jgi:RNA polymerase sigma-70 factor (ECF subfamily)
MATFNFNSSFNELAPNLNSYAYNLTQNMEDAKDLFQETAFRAMKNSEKFKVDTNMKAWLFTIMKNIFINNYRRKVKTRVINDSSDNLYYLNSGKASIDNRGDSTILMKELMTLVDDLEESFRIPFLMHYQGFKYQEIADKFELPLGTIKSKIFFARRRLKAQIKNRYTQVDELLLSA